VYVKCQYGIRRDCSLTLILDWRKSQLNSIVANEAAASELVQLSKMHRSIEFAWFVGVVLLAHTHSKSRDGAQSGAVSWLMHLLPHSVEFKV
jgi:hypothetical protein